MTSPFKRDPATDSDASGLYRAMATIRQFEEMLLELFDEGRLSGTTHTCIGQEANSVGVVSALRPGDHLFGNHRSHGHYLAATADIRGLLAELMGRPEGVCKGVGGSQHLCAPGFKTNGVLASTLAPAAGIAWAKKLAGNDNVSVAFIGDGALGQGIVYETLNIAALWALPLLIVVENNLWAQSTPIDQHLAGSIGDRFQAFGIAATELKTTDVVEIAEASASLLQTMRTNPQPLALIVECYRFSHHSINDDHRPPEEIARHRATDPLVVHGCRLTAERRQQIESEIKRELEQALADLESDE